MERRRSSAASSTMSIGSDRRSSHSSTGSISPTGTMIKKKPAVPPPCAAPKPTPKPPVSVPVVSEETAPKPPQASPKPVPAQPQAAPKPTPPQPAAKKAPPPAPPKRINSQISDNGMPFI